MIEVVDCSDVPPCNMTRILVEVEADEAADRLGAWPWRWLLTGRSTRATVSRE